MIEQIVTPSMGTIAKQLKKYSGRGRMVLIGPVRTWFDQNYDRDSYGLVAVTHDATHHECCFDSMIFFGAVATEPPPEVVAAVDTERL
jgi:hypothetical protein